MSFSGARLNDYYSSRAEFIRYSSFCNPLAISHRYLRNIQVALLTGRVLIEGSLGGSGLSFLLSPAKTLL